MAVIRNIVAAFTGSTDTGTGMINHQNSVVGFTYSVDTGTGVVAIRTLVLAYTDLHHSGDTVTKGTGWHFTSFNVELKMLPKHPMSSFEIFCVVLGSFIFLCPHSTLLARWRMPDT